MSALFGLLNVDKPAGLTSRDVVNRIQRLVRPAKCGHAGTLDPLATGVLIVCVGPATRLVSYVQEKPKQYRARFLLGCRSDTDDVTGQVTEVDGAEPVPAAQLRECLHRFVGRIEQIPPQFSAVRVGGQRAYKLARKGRPADLKPRPVDVYRINLVEFDFPRLELEIECGSGTYIRSIGRDLGERLGCGAVMSELARTRIGAFDRESAVDLDLLTQQNVASYLVPATAAVDQLPQERCRAEDVETLRFGRPVGCARSGLRDSQTVAVVAPDGQLACLARYDAAKRRLAPKQVFVS